MMPNIYYIEDVKEHFDSVVSMLENHNFEMFPKPARWATEINYFIEFLHSQTSQEKKKPIIDLLIRDEIDLLLIDVGLGVDALGNGEDIYRNLILKTPSLHSIPVIYLTMLGRGSVTLSSKTRHVTKVFDNKNQLKVSAIENDLLKKINELLRTPDFFDRVIRSL